MKTTPEELEEDDMTELIYIGLDGEMTSDELDNGGSLCQIGVAKSLEQRFVRDVGCWAGTVFKPASMVVHGLSEKYLLEEAPSSFVVDNLLYEFLQGIGANSEKKILVPIGFNVMAFDMPFVRKALPKSFSLFSRRGIDLNAVVFTIGGQLYFGGSYPTWKGFKRLSKDFAGAYLDSKGVARNDHDAGYDALQAVYAWKYLKAIIAGAKSEKEIHIDA